MSIPTFCISSWHFPYVFSYIHQMLLLPLLSPNTSFLNSAWNGNVILILRWKLFLPFLLRILITLIFANKTLQSVLWILWHSSRMKKIKWKFSTATILATINMITPQTYSSHFCSALGSAQNLLLESKITSIFKLGM